ncbi:thioredoxin family protein [Kallipyga massiliensis]|uniref:thioredoxin family protein n=1 Tax=Kallipyga massiliensis TaxID=1472764 RepID=UPI0004AE5599|nr:thioredoxin domain-containing protein [Kallipyga massiliensis]
MKANKKILLVALVLALGLTACGEKKPAQESQSSESQPVSQAEPVEASSSAEESSSEEDSEEEKAEKAAYNELVKTYPAITINQVEEARDKKEDRLIYMGATYCPYCRKFIPLLDEVAKKEGWTLYYMDAEAQGEEFDRFAEGIQVEYIPAILVVKEGKVLAYDTNHFTQPFTKEDIQRKVESLLNN